MKNKNNIEFYSCSNWAQKEQNNSNIRISKTKLPAWILFERYWIHFKNLQSYSFFVILFPLEGDFSYVDLFLGKNRVNLPSYAK